MELPPGLKAWRDSERARLTAACLAIPLAERARQDERINESLLEAFAPLAGRAIGFYWPMKAECDVRAAASRWHALGSPMALPVVVKKGSPLAYRRWSPGRPMGRDQFGVPVPEHGALLAPEILLAPPVGFDEQGYRLGHGTAYIDRTLASLHPQPLKIAVARDAARIPTIRPQPHDIPMDFVVTERGINEVTESGLRLIEPSDAGRAALRILESRRLASDGIGATETQIPNAPRARQS